jgi:exopolysaccharide biosynthesis polyprenyl glycosylphosphotransferase
MSSSHFCRHDRAAIRQRLVGVSFLGDMLVITLALLAAYGLKFNTAMRHLGVADVGMTVDQYLGHIIFGVTLLMCLLANFRMYSPAYLHSVRRHWRIIGQSLVIWLLSYLSILLILKVDPPVSRVYGVIGGGLAFFGLIVWRQLFHRFINRQRWQARMQQRVLFIGWNEESDKLIRSLQESSQHVYDLVGAVSRTEWAEGERPVPWLGHIDDLDQVLEAQGIDLVILTDVGLPKPEMLGLISLCEKAMVEFKLIPNVFQIFVSGLHLETFCAQPVLGISRLPLHSAFNQAVKRGVDILGGFFGLMLSAPILLIFGLMIKLEDRGPIFYRQIRTGRNGKPFAIFKLRSMRLDSERNGRAGWTVKNDPRCLRVGAFMRRWNIDEVPQFWNVLRGDMSLVGPRPERPELISQFKHEIRHYNARHHIKPGITGWAQVNGLRGDTDLTERVKYDLFYIENWNCWLDFQIMVMTFFKRENAC